MNGKISRAVRVCKRGPFLTRLKMANVRFDLGRGNGQDDEMARVIAMISEGRVKYSHAI